MLYIDNPNIDVFFNLAAEEYLLKDFDQNIFMVWQSSPSVVIGRHQNVRAEVDINYAETNGIDIARRYSGGGAVYHDPGNLNLTFIESAGHIGFDKYADMTARALQHLGLKPELDERRSIYLSGLKISGSAQCVYKHRLMYHATLLFDADLHRLTNVLNGEADDISSASRVQVRSVKSPVTNIKPYLHGVLSVADFRTKIVKHLLEDGGEYIRYSWSEEDLTVINRIRESRYATASWNGIRPRLLSSCI
jgi:Lipoate-protein ligase A